MAEFAKPKPEFTEDDKEIIDKAVQSGQWSEIEPLLEKYGNELATTYTDDDGYTFLYII